MTAILLRSPSRKIAAMLALADQATSSITNFGVVLVAARVLNVEGFGVFTMVYLIYGLFVGAVQAWVAQELALLRHTGTSRFVAVKSSLRITALVCLPVAALLVVIGVVAGSSGGQLLIALGVLFVPLMLHEALRSSAAFLRAPQLALVGDMAWLMLAALLLAAVVALGVPTSASLFTAWAAAGATSALLMYAVLRRPMSRVRTVWRRYLSREFLGHRFLGEYALVTGSQNLSLLSLGFLASPAVVGALRGAATLFAPLRAVFNAVASFGTPQLLDISPKRRTTAMLSLSVFFALIAVAITAIFLVVPPTIGSLILGDTWRNVVPILLPTGLQFVAMAFSRLGYVALRTRDPKATMPLRVAASAIFLVLFFLGFFLWGIQGAAWGGAAAVTIQAVIVWWSFFSRPSEKTLVGD